jgi:general secretion pathway protein A
MYEEFFGLNTSPFQLSPDPFFMIPSEKSTEALTLIPDAIRLRKGFVVMTGEVGTGKTLVLRCLIESLEQEQISFAYFIGPRLSTVDFLSYIAFELGLSVAEPSKGNLLRALYVFLLEQFEKGLTTVLIIDEAHQMPRSVLEEIRLLTNFETAQQKLVQIVLVGQPELDKKLDQVELRSLKQRIAVRCHLEPLGAADVARYIERRLELAGAGPLAATLFPPETAEAVYRYSQGIPRLINSICDQALASAYTRQVRVVPVEIVKSVAAHFRLEPAAAPKHAEKASSLIRQAEKSAEKPAEKFVPESSPQAGVASSAPPAKSREVPAPVPHLEGNGAALTQTALAMMSEEPKRLAVADGAIHHERKLHLENAASLGTPPHAAVPEFAPPAASAPRPRRAAQPTVFPRHDEEGAPGPQSVSKTDHETRHEARKAARSRIRQWLKPGLRLSLFIGLVAIVPAALATGLFMARHQRTQGTTQHALSAKNALPANATLNTAAAPDAPHGAMPSASLVQVVAPHIGSDRATPIAQPESLAPRPKAAVSPAPKPILAPPPRAPSAQTLVPASAPPKEAEPAKPPLGNTISPTPSSPATVISNSPAPAEIQPKELSPGNRVFESPAPPPVAPAPSIATHLDPPRLLSSPAPLYPSVARASNMGGPVVIDAVVDVTGRVTEMRVLSGNPVLRKAAMDGLSRWKYEPARLNGQPTTAHVQVRIDFTPH